MAILGSTTVPEEEQAINSNPPGSGTDNPGVPPPPPATPPPATPPPPAGAGNPAPDTPNYDPSKPVYAEPENNFDNVDVELKNGADYVDPSTSTVEGRISKMMSEGNPLLELARFDNDRKFQARGLMDSAQGVAGGTLAMLRAATEIATPDAALYGDMAKMQQKGDIDAAMNNQVAGLENQRNIMNARLSAALQEMDYGQKVELQKLVDTAQLQRVEVDNKWKQRINYDNLTSNERTAMLGVAQALGQELTGGIERILRDTNISDKTSAVQALMATYESQMTTAASIVSLKLKWS